MCALRLCQAQLLQRLGTETCTSHTVLQLRTHFLIWTNLLVLVSRAFSTQDKTTLIPSFIFAHPLTSKHYTDSKAKAEDVRMKENPLASQLTVECSLLQAAHQLSAHHALNGHVRRHSWLGPRSNLTQLCRSHPNQKLVESNQQQMLSNSDLAQIFWQPLQCSSLIYF